MAPPKRRTGGRVTPKGTKPGDLPRAAAAPIGAGGTKTATRSTSASAGVNPSSRYTPPIPRSIKESPKWVPILMVVCFIIGVLAILARYLLSDDVGNWLVFAGLGFVLVGLYTATKWH